MAEITYFEKTGAENTLATLKIALERCKTGDIEAVVIASTYGESAMQAAEVFKGSGISLLVVGEVLDGVQQPTGETRAALEKDGHSVMWGTAMGEMSSFSRDQAAALVADAYRRVSEGFKVVSEIVLMATSQGFLRPGQRVLAMAGTHRGADTAVVASAASYQAFKQFEIHEILCKPYRRARE